MNRDSSELIFFNPKDFERIWRTKMTGTVKKILADKLYGFITAEDGKDYFFHQNSCRDLFNSLMIGSRVSFNVDDTNAKGPRADNVELTED